MLEVEAFYRALAEHPSDWVTWSVLADWYEEHDQLVVAGTLRWMAEQHKRPFRHSSRTTTTWSWYDETYYDADPESNIPTTFYKRLSEAVDNGDCNYCRYRSLPDAVAALVAAMFLPCTETPHARS